MQNYWEIYFLTFLLRNNMSKISKEAYENLIEQDLEWLNKQPHSLEKDHIRLIIVDYEIDKPIYL